MAIVHFVKRMLSRSPGFKCGAMKDEDDSRDYIKEIDLGTKPEYVNLLEGLNWKATWQGDTNACTGHAISNFLTILYSKLSKEKILRFNYYYPYYWSRMLAFGTIKKDQGSYLRQTMRAIQRYGALTTDMCSLSSVYKAPKKDETELGRLLAIKDYFRLPNDRIHKAIMYTIVRERLPVILALKVKTKEWDIANSTKILKPIASSAPYVGGHAICAYGYDPSDECVLAANSWGELWADKGTFKISKESLERDIMDAWTTSFNYF